MEPRHVPVSPLALAIGVVVLLLAAFGPAHAEPAEPAERGPEASISVR